MSKTLVRRRAEGLITRPAIEALAGFATSYPVNWWLLRSGIKEAM
jgi:hypothetical protein